MTRVRFSYKNHRNEIADRTIEVTSLDYCPVPNNHYGYGPGWFLTGYDFTGERKGEQVRSFALCNIQMPEELFKHMTNNRPFRIDLTSDEVKAAIREAQERNEHAADAMAYMAQGFENHREPGEFGEGATVAKPFSMEAIARKAGVDLGGNPLPVDAPKSAVDEILKK